ncbi:MAG: heme d1 biosynthesis radical SAM protein NirJ, partial [Dehalococcoidia bacterium]
AIWGDTSHPTMEGLKSRPRPLEGRCAVCPALPLCNGNLRVRAETATGDMWAPDPACYLTDAELKKVGEALNGL